MIEIKFDLSNFEAVEIVPIADVHIGNPLCQEHILNDIIEYIKEEPDDPKMARICLLNGDLTESVTKHSVGNLYDLTMSPSVQVATMINYLLPLTETSEKYPQGKILSYCSGNHDFGRYKDTGISASESIAVKLGLEDRYSNDGCYSFINLKRIETNETTPVTLYNQHMSGGGATIGGKANRIAKINGIIAQIIVGSHVHQPITFKEDIIMPSANGRGLTQRTITYVVTNSFLSYGDYAERSGMRPNTIAIPKIYVRQGRERKGRESRYFYTEVLL